MKRMVLSLLVLLGCLTMKASPVSLEEARSLGQRFVRANFELTRQSDELTLVYSMPSFYVFNVGETGFVMISAYDNYRPLLGYSQEGTFNPDDMAPATADFLNRVNDYRTTRTNVAATPDVVADWESLRNYGHLVSRYGGRDGSYLVQTKWNQNYPYNYCCPAASGGPGGHVYAGCVATAGAQVMRYWCHPEHGQGSHTYYPEDHPEYGPLTANFGETTYDWDNMPLTISSASPIEQLEAVGTLIYHVGVSVDMNYRPTSSGAVTGLLTTTLPEHFFYTTHMEHNYRENYTREQYCNFLVSNIDMSWPILHRGNGHAYVVDGYDDAGLFHFNWGWSGSNDAFYDIDGHNYAEGESAILNCVPAEVYDATPKEPTSLTATPAANNELATTVSWTNPTQTLVNNPLTTIDQIVVMRNNDIVYTEDNVTPGATMSITDTSVPFFSTYTYKVYAVINGQRGKTAEVNGIHVGPTCQWKFVISGSNMMGWRGSRIDVYDYTGAKVTSVSVNSPNPASVNVDMPLGMVKLAWVLSDNVTSDYGISINVKDANNTSVYSYSGNILSMEEGFFYEGNNGCGQTPDCGTPSNLTAVQDSEDDHVVVLQWNGVDNPDYGYLVYRDDMMLAMTSETTFRDETATIGGHCYYVTTLCNGGMNGEYSNMACQASGACYPPRNFYFEVTNNFKCNLTWERPSPDDGLSGYILYRKMAGEEYERIKLLGANKTSHTDNSVSQEGDYYYKLVAYYQGLDCESAPAANLNEPNVYHVHFYYSIDAVDESDDHRVSLYPNPTTGMLNVEAPSMQHLAVYNMLGQLVFETNVNGDSTSINMKEFGSGMFMVSVQTADGIVIKKISVVE
ncbi:MAG: C10 family peptidase [Bacteroidales bacterium]|nr:C10 family peptidase [Bacteroidales bacterium]